MEKSSNLKATFEPHIEEVKQLSFKMTYFQNLVPKLVRNLSNSIATFSLIFAKNTSNSSLNRKMELPIKKKCVGCMKMDQVPSDVVKMSYNFMIFLYLIS